MQRRELLKLLAIGSAFPAVPSRLFAACREIHASAAAGAALKILSGHQDATVTAMAELLIPRTETPGATDTKVNLFIDHIVADWYSDQERAAFLKGLADVDLRSRSLFQKNFVELSPPRQAEILRSLGEQLTEAREAVPGGPRGTRGSRREPQDNFYLQFRGLALHGYFTSEAGFAQQLHQEIIPGRFDGCAPIASASRTKGS